MEKLKCFSRPWRNVLVYRGLHLDDDSETYCSFFFSAAPLCSDHHSESSHERFALFMLDVLRDTTWAQTSSLITELRAPLQQDFIFRKKNHSFHKVESNNTLCREIPFSKANKWPCRYITLKPSLEPEFSIWLLIWWICWKKTWSWYNPLIIIAVDE